jgi:hypothetical protein
VGLTNSAGERRSGSVARSREDHGDRRSAIYWTFSGAGRRALSASMSKRLDAIHSELSTPERILLFCVASGTEWEWAGVTGATVTVLVVRGLIERDAGGRLVLTKQGRAALDAMIG